MLATIWQILNMQMQYAKTGNRNYGNLLKLAWKIREITSSELIFGGFLSMWNHFVLLWPRLQPLIIGLRSSVV